MNEAKKKGLWHNIWAKRRRGERPARPGEKGYPKTLKIGEAALRSIIRRELIREWTFLQASMSGNAIKGLISVLEDMFGPTTTQRLERTGDDKIIDRYHAFFGMLHTLPEYRMVWENYKQAQRSHASMDPGADYARDPNHPIGKAFESLKSKVLGKLDELERTLSPETRDIWKSDLDEQRYLFRKVFEDWARGKMTTGRVLTILDSRGTVESRRRRRSLSEAGEMVAGRDLEQLQTTEFITALETADMDLEDAGCPEDSDARVFAFEAMEMIEKGRERPGYSVTMIAPIAQQVIEAIRSCPHVDKYVAQRVANDLELALDRTQEVDRF
jgi:hypothetical protein